MAQSCTYNCRKLCEDLNTLEWHYYYFTQQNNIDENISCSDHQNRNYRDFVIVECMCEEAQS